MGHQLTQSFGLSTQEAEQAHSLGVSIREGDRLAALGDDGEATSGWSGERSQEGWWVGMLP